MTGFAGNPSDINYLNNGPTNAHLRPIMSNRAVVALVLAVLASTSACAPSRAAIAAGAGSIVLGGLSLAAGQPNSTCEGSEHCGFSEGLFDSVADDVHDGQRQLGGALMIGGAALVIVGLIASRSSDDVEQPAPASALAFAPAQRIVGAPGASVGATDPNVERTASPAEMALRSRIENRLALQASFSARRGDCVAAVASSVRLAEVDPAMHAELVRTDADLANCLALAAAAQN